jgi:glycosyltransferase involved in cell wall biosynthesis
MKIVYFISHFPYPDQLTNLHLINRYVCSGGEWAAYHLAVEQSKLGHEVSVVTSSVLWTDGQERNNGLTIYRYGSRFKIGETLFAPGMFFRPLKDVAKPDIVHIHHTTPPGGMAGLVCNRSWKRPLVVTHHGFENPDSYGSVLRRVAMFLSSKYYLDFLFKAAERIICISPAFIRKSRFLRKYASKTVFIPNGIYPQEYNSDIPREQARTELGLAASERYGLFVGSLIPPKGLGVLLQALPEIIKSFENFNLIVLGRGPAENEFRQQALNLGVSGNVHFVGFIGETYRKLLYYRASDVLIIPSFQSEMYCFVLYEGAAAGCSLVTSDLDAFTMVIKDHINGILTPAGNSAEIGRAVMEVLQNKGLQSRLMHGSQTQISPPTWSDVSRRTEKLYMSLCTAEDKQTRKAMPRGKIQRSLK